MWIKVNLVFSINLWRHPFLVMIFITLFVCLLLLPDNELESSYIQNLYTVRYHGTFWGTTSILKVINPVALEKYRWLMGNITPRLEDLPSIEGYSVSCFG